MVDFASGIRIDYRVPQVEIDGRIILRRGDLELFAYSKARTPKEHESIVLLDAKPKSVFQALGLIGLTPGKPTRYFYETQTVRLPTGDPVDVLVRYKDGDQEKTASACGWMTIGATKNTMPATHWLFTGSETAPNGDFYADYEGTTVTVVDFPSSLLSLPDRHSESNEELWLLANTEAIPPERTKVTLILRPVPTELRIRVEADGQFTLLTAQPDLLALASSTSTTRPAISKPGELRFKTGDALVDALMTHTRGWADRATLKIESAAGAPAAAADWIRAALKKAGIGEPIATTEPPPASAPHKP